MQSFVAPTRPIFNRSRFQELTLDDKTLQASLLAAFSREAKSLRCSIAAAAMQGAEAFEEVIHRAKNVSHFVGGDRLTQMLAEVDKAYLLGRKEDRSRAAHAIVGEIDALEQALATDNGADPRPGRRACPGSGHGGIPHDATEA